MTNSSTAQIKVVEVLAYDHENNGSVIASFEQIKEAREYACKVGSDPAHQNVRVRYIDEDDNVVQVGQFFGGQWFDSPTN
jgi:hypothetical protein